MKNQKKFKDIETLTRSLRDVHVRNDFMTREDAIVELGCTRSFINKAVHSGKVRKLARGFISRADATRAVEAIGAGQRWQERTDAPERLPYCLVPVLKRWEWIWPRAKRFFDLQTIPKGCNIDT